MKAKKVVKVSQVRPRWTKEETKVLRTMYPSHSNIEIAKVIGRKVSSVVFKAHRLGLAKNAKRLKQMGKENIALRWGNK